MTRARWIVGNVRVRWPAHSILLRLICLLASVVNGDVLADPPTTIERPPQAAASPPTPAPLPTASIDENLSIGGSDIKAHQVDTRLTIPVNVDGQGPYQFLVDSGADASAIGLHTAASLRLPLSTPVMLETTTGRELVPRVKISELKLGTTTVRNLEVPTLREADVGANGLIGIDALVQQRLLLDFESRIIKVEDIRTPQEYDPGAIVITARRRRGQLILTQVRAAGITLDAIIDTGSEVTIGNSALRDKLLHRNFNGFWTVPATGVTGKVMILQMARVPQLQLGPVTLNDIPVAFADVSPFELFGLSHQPALLLGTDMLATFRRVSLDFGSRKVRFQLRRCETRSVVISTAPPDMYSRISGTDSRDVCAR